MSELESHLDPASAEFVENGARMDGLVKEVPISFTDRVRGSSKMSGRIVVEAMVLVTWWGIRERVLRFRR